MPAICRLRPPPGASRIRAGGGGADISVLGDLGVPLIEVEPDTTRYFDWHHTAADTLDKVQPSELQHQAAAFAAVTWLLADSDVVLPRVPPKSKADEE
jgi:Zn-dependent M28 family amino/carboxypeptidase